LFRLLSIAFFTCLLAPNLLHAQELPYFVTYSHHLEEPGSLEIETKTAAAKPLNGEQFYATSTEFEYGTTAWWTSELYLDSQSTLHQSTIFTGFRIENRLRPLPREHFINPVLYVEIEDINGANKSILEIVGHDGRADLTEDNATARAERKREAEFKLILSSNVKGWNFSENIIGEKNLTHAPWEFGYALAASRPLRLKASAHDCRFCAENFQAGVEMYGGLGDIESLGTHNTSHYVAPTVIWSPGAVSFRASPGFGLNDYSLQHVFRIGLSYEVGQVRELFRKQERSAR
jgi:hypothetical protein